MDKAERLEVFNRFRKLAKRGKGMPVFILTDADYLLGSKLKFWDITKNDLNKARKHEDLFIGEQKTAFGKVMLFLDLQGSFLEDSFGVVASDNTFKGEF